MNREYAPPRPGAIQCVAPMGAFARPGDYILFDEREGVVLNLTRGDRLPLGGDRRSMHFAGSPPGVSDVHVPLPLQGWLSEYSQAMYLLDRLVQTQPVTRELFKYRQGAASNAQLIVDLDASSMSSAKQVQHDTSVVEASTADMRVGAFIPYRTASQADYPYEQAVARVCWRALSLWREYKAFKTSGLLTSTANWHSSVRVARNSTQNWGPPGSEGVDSDPIADLLAMRRASMKKGKPISVYAMSLDQSDWFLQHPKVIDWFTRFNAQGVTAGIVRAMMAEQSNSKDYQVPLEFSVPNVGRVLVHAVSGTTDPDTDADLFWPIDIVLGFAHSDSVPPNNDVCSAVTFRLDAPAEGANMTPPPGSAEGITATNGFRVRRYPLPGLGSGGDALVIDLAEKTVFTNNDVGSILSGVS